MAYVPTLSSPVTEMINGRKHTYYALSEAGGGATDAVLIPAPSVWCTVTLIECKLTTAGDATTVRPMIGVGTVVGDFVQDERGPSTDSAAAAVRNVTNQRLVVPPLSSIIWRSVPDGTAGVVASRICIVEGHI